MYTKIYTGSRSRSQSRYRRIGAYGTRMTDCEYGERYYDIFDKEHKHGDSKESHNEYSEKFVGDRYIQNTVYGNRYCDMVEYDVCARREGILHVIITRGNASLDITVLILGLSGKFLVIFWKCHVIDFNWFSISCFFYQITFYFFLQYGKMTFPTSNTKTKVSIRVEEYVSGAQHARLIRIELIQNVIYLYISLCTATCIATQRSIQHRRKFKGGGGWVLKCDAEAVQWYWAFVIKIHHLDSIHSIYFPITNAKNKLCLSD